MKGLMAEWAISLDETTDPTYQDQAHLARLLSKARLSEVVTSVAELGPRPSVWERVFSLDASVRLGESALTDIEGLSRELSGSHRWHQVRPWLEALRAEYLLWRGDTGAVAIAAPLLAELPRDTLVPLELLVPRARLRRIMALAAVFAGERTTAGDLLADAAADFARAGWPAERAMTLALQSVVHVGVFMDDFELMCRVASEASAILRDLGSPLEREALLGETVVALAAGELVQARSAMARLGAIALPGTLPALGLDVLSAAVDLLGADVPEAALEELEVALGRFRSRYPEPARMFTVNLAHVFCDLGWVSPARRFREQAEFAAERSLLGTRDRAALGIRLRLLGGDEAALADALGFLEQLEAGGLVRDSAAKAGRFAQDCHRGGLVAQCEILCQWSAKRLPPPGELTIWEALWTRRHGDAQPAPAVEVMLLGAHLSIRRAERTVQLKGHTARLLAVLVAADGQLGTEQLIDRLWPDADLDAGRNRLNVTLHRLKRALGVHGGEVLTRTATSVRFSPPRGWKVDAWEFRRLARGDIAEVHEAFELYHDHFCSQQLAYDDAIAEERRLLQAVLISCVQRLSVEADADLVHLAERVLRLHLDDVQLRESLADRLEAGGNRTLADQLRAMQ